MSNGGGGGGWSLVGTRWRVVKMGGGGFYSHATPRQSDVTCMSILFFYDLNNMCVIASSTPHTQILF